MFRRKKKKKVFGVHLVKMKDVPPLITHSIQYLRNEGLEETGIFRLSGSTAKINELKLAYDKGKKVDLSMVPDPNTVASLFKLYLREMPVPLLTFELYDPLLLGYEAPDRPTKLLQLKRVIACLPPIHGTVLKELCCLLNEIAQHSSENKMPASNLSLVIAPNILRPEEDQLMGSMLSAGSSITGIVETMISDYDYIFEGKELVEEEEEEEDLEEEFSRRLKSASVCLDAKVAEQIREGLQYESDDEDMADIDTMLDNELQFDSEPSADTLGHVQQEEESDDFGNLQVVYPAVDETLESEPDPPSEQPYPEEPEPYVHINSDDLVFPPQSHDEEEPLHDNDEKVAVDENVTEEYTEDAPEIQIGPPDETPPQETIHSSRSNNDIQASLAPPQPVTQRAATTIGVTAAANDSFMDPSRISMMLFKPPPIPPPPDSPPPGDQGLFVPDSSLPHFDDIEAGITADPYADPLIGAPDNETDESADGLVNAIFGNESNVGTIKAKGKKPVEGVKANVIRSPSPPPSAALNTSFSDGNIALHTEEETQLPPPPVASTIEIMVRTASLRAPIPAPLASAVDDTTQWHPGHSKNHSFDATTMKDTRTTKDMDSDSMGMPPPPPLFVTKGALHGRPSANAVPSRPVVGREPPPPPLRASRSADIVMPPPKSVKSREELMKSPPQQALPPPPQPRLLPVSALTGLISQGRMSEVKKYLMSLPPATRVEENKKLIAELERMRPKQ